MRALLFAVLICVSSLVRADLLNSLLFSTATNLAQSDETSQGAVPAPPAQRARAHTELGAAYFGNGQLGVALEELNIAINADSGYAPAWSVLALVYMSLKEDDQARRAFEKSLDLNSNDSETRNNFGWFLCQRGEARESIKHFLVALKNPLYATPEKPYLNAGLCSAKIQDDASAEDYLVKALKLQPRMPVAWLTLAEIRLRKGDFAAARENLSRYMGLMTNPTAEALWLGVKIEHRSGEKDGASNYGFLLQKRFPDSREAQAMRDGKFE